MEGQYAGWDLFLVYCSAVLGVVKQLPEHLFLQSGCVLHVGQGHQVHRLGVEVGVGRSGRSKLRVSA